MQEKFSELLKKYNKNIPRYTSYPPVPYWNGAPSWNQWILDVKRTCKKGNAVDVYIHIPYCKKLCWYCGCNRKVTNDSDVFAKYIDALKVQWQMYSKSIRNIKINSIHFGGGTPNAINSELLDELLTFLKPFFTDKFKGSIELDPRLLSRDFLKVLDKHRILRLSFGIQDFDPDVQKAINRVQSQKLIESKLKMINEFNFESMNFDLILGLPKQSTKTIQSTMNIVARMKPDLIALYSYAHLPSKISNQRLIKDDELPSESERAKMYSLTRKLLKKAGYLEVGMDHFCLKDSFLYKSLIDRKITRNFMGYVDKKSNCLIGLGATSISNTDNYYVQNPKIVKDFFEQVENDLIIFENGHELNENDKCIAAIIQDIMCLKKIDLSKINNLPNNSEIFANLSDMQKDKLVYFEMDQVQITPLGTAFLRNIASLFDKNTLKPDTKTTFSRSV